MVKGITYFIIFLLSIGQCFAGEMIINPYSFITTGGSCDSCTGDLSFSWHMENIDVGLGTPCGCVVSGDDTATLTTATLSSAISPQDGTYSLLVPGNSDFAEFDVSSEDLVAGEAGRIDFWFYIADSTVDRQLNSIIVDTSNRIFIDFKSTNKVRFFYAQGGSVAEYVTTTATFTDATWTHCVASWSVAGESGNTLRVGINTTQTDPTFDNDTDTLTDIGSPVKLYIGSFNGVTGVYSIDNMKIYKAW